jgi:hypothetical protein
MTQGFSSDFDKVLRLVGTHVQSPTKDYGIVVEITTVSDISGDQKYIALMDSGKSIDANSILRLLRANRLRENKVTIAYPDGSAFAKYVSGAKKLHKGHGITFANLDQTVTVDNVTIDITLTKSTGNDFPEENTQEYKDRVSHIKQVRG